MVNEVLNIDCMDYMKDIPDKWFELAIVDPPYGIGAGKGTEIYIKNDKWKTEKKSNDKTIYGNWDNAVPDDEYFKQLFRVSKNQIIWGGNYFNLPPTPCLIIWDKKNGDSFFADGECAWTSFKSKLRIFPFLSCGFMGSHKNRDERIHPTQKPVDLYKWLLKNYAKPIKCNTCNGSGDIESITLDCDVQMCRKCKGKGFIAPKILDTHIGSGSIRIACHDMGFDLYGCELDPDYHKAQEERYQRHIQQAELFSFEGGQIND